MTRKLRKIHEHRRVNDILLGPLERPALRWLSARVPGWIGPDAMTLIGVLGAVLILVGYGLSQLDRAYLWLASLGFVINWFGDSLDGTLARYRKIERPKYGFFVDHTTDAVCQVMIFLGLGLTPYIGLGAATMALIAYLLLSVLVYVRTCVSGEFKISYGRLGPTEIRALAILLNTLMYLLGLRSLSVPFPRFGPVEVSIYDVFVGSIGLLLLVFFFNTAWKQARLLASTEE